MTETSVEKRVGLFAVFLLSGAAVFVVPAVLAGAAGPRAAGTARAVISVVFLVAAVTAHQFTRLNKYWLVLFAFFTAAFCLLMATYWGSYGVRIFSLAPRTPAGWAAARLSEAVVVLFFVLLLTTMIRSDLSSIYLQRGDLKKGLVVGGSTFVVLAAAGCVWAALRGVAVSRLLSWLPWIFVFVLAKGFVEELLYRGVLLKRLEQILGRWPSNALTATAFALAQVKAAHISNIPAWVAISLVLGLVWGYVTQKTDSVIGSTLFHAGADVAVAFGILMAL